MITLFITIKWLYGSRDDDNTQVTEIKTLRLPVLPKPVLFKEGILT